MARRRNMETGEAESSRGKKPTPGGTKKVGSESGRKVGRAAERAVAERNKKKPGLSKRDGSRVKAAAERGSKKPATASKPTRASQVKEAEDRVAKASPSSRRPTGQDHAAARRVRVARGENSSKEIGGKNYGHTGTRNAKTASLDDYITMMAAETGDKYVKGAGKAGAATSKKGGGNSAPARKNSSDSGRASQSGSQPASSRGGSGGARNNGSNNNRSVQPSRPAASAAKAPSGQNKPPQSQPQQNRPANPAPRQQPVAQQPRPQAPRQQQQPRPQAPQQYPYQGNIGPQYPYNPLQGMQAAQGILGNMGSGQQGYAPPPGVYRGPGAYQMHNMGNGINRMYQNARNSQSPIFTPNPNQHRGW